jgi:PAS domain S-box-containing protein
MPKRGPRTPRDAVNRGAARESLEALRQAHALLEATLESTADGILVVDLDGKIVRFNAKFARLWRIPDEILAARDDDRALAFVLDQLEDPDAFLRKVRELYRDLEAESFDTLRFKDGRVFERYSQPERLGRRVVGRVWSFRDVTDHVRALEALRLSEARFRGLVEDSPDAIIGVGDDGLVTLMNARAEALFGWTRAELIGKRVDLLVPSAVRERHAAHRAAYLAAPRVREMGLGLPLHACRRDGSEFPVEIVLSPLMSERAPMVMAVVRDLTERRRTEEALVRSETRYRELFERASYGIYRSTLDGRFLYCNPALARMLGYDSPADLLRLHLDRDVYVDPDERHRLIAEYTGARDIPPREVRWKRRNGSLAIVRLRARAVPADAQAGEGFEVIAEDVTEQRELEAHLRQAHKMEAVGRLTGGIAHDFNNLLTVILGGVEMARASVPAAYTEAHGDLQSIRLAAESGAALIRKLLSFSRREALTLEPLDLGAVVTDHAVMLRRLLPESLALDLDAPAGLGEVSGDVVAIEQILLNLATNARDAMVGGGTIRITLRRLDAAEVLAESPGEAARHTQPGEWIELAVADSGSGMDADTKARVFEPFFTTKPPSVGTGLGLAVVYGLVRQLQGRILIESERGVGTTVRVFFPLVSALDSVPEGPRSRGAAGGGREGILVVEDETRIRALATRILSRYGYRVFAARNGEEALDLFKAHEAEIALVVSDVVMLQMGGRALGEALRAAGKTVPILLTSGYTGEHTGEWLAASTGISFLSKPWTPESLAQRVRDVLDGGSGRGA